MGSSYTDFTEKIHNPHPEETAFEQLYNDIIGNLLICPDHRPEGIVAAHHSSIFSATYPHMISSQYMISQVRARLTEHLSRVSKEIGINIRYILLYDFLALVQSIEIY